MLVSPRSGESVEGFGEGESVSGLREKRDKGAGSLRRGELSRAEFLRLACGAGLGLSLPGVFGAGEARAAEMLAGGGFPIGLWWPPPPGETNVERYREIKEAGFDFVIGGNGVANDTVNPRALEAAASNGLRFVLADALLRRAIDGTSGSRAVQSVSGGASPHGLLREEEVEESLEGEDGTVRALNSADSREAAEKRLRELFELYGSSPALAGVNLYDEPHSSLFGALAHAKGVLRTLDSGLLPYINVWPSHAAPSAMGARDYPTYLQQYVSAVRPPVLSFDHYPLLAGGAVTRDYFYNWAQVRRHSLQAGAPSWVFIQSVDFDGRAVGLAPRRRPSFADLLWQVNVSLAYGAKGIQYFTYWTPENAGASFGQALISRDGARTPLYSYARSVNAYLRALGAVMVPLVSEIVSHAREKQPPYGASPFRGDGWTAAASGSPVILSRFRRPGSGRRVRFLLVVNRHAFRAADTTLTLGSRVAGISGFSPGTNRFVSVRRPRKERGPRKLRVRLAPGAARLFVLRRR